LFLTIRCELQNIWVKSFTSKFFDYLSQLITIVIWITDLREDVKPNLYSDILRSFQ